MATVESASLCMKMFRKDNRRVDLREFAMIFPDDSFAKPSEKEDEIIQPVGEYKLDYEADDQREDNESSNSFPID